MGKQDDRGLMTIGGGDARGGGDGLRELAVYICWGRYLEKGGD